MPCISHPHVCALTAALVALAFLGGCASPPAPNAEVTPGKDLSDTRSKALPTPATAPDLSPQQFQEGLTKAQEEGRAMSRADFAKRYAPPARVGSLSYDPLDADNLDVITKRYALSEAQRATLKRDGMVVLGNHGFGAPAHIYGHIYHDHQPVFVTADSLLYAWHRSYDSALKDLELSALRPELIAMLADMHGALAKRAPNLPQAQQAAAHDADVYLTVARALLTAQPGLKPVYGDVTQPKVQEILAAADRLQPKKLALFGGRGTYDYSQLKPRGHYTEHRDLKSYFRAMMWIGRTELKLVTFPPGEPPRLNRTAVEGAALLNALLNASGARARWDRFDRAITAMIGEHDSMTPPQMDAFMKGLGLADVEAVAKAQDGALLQGLLSSPFGTQRIMSQIMHSDINDPKSVKLPRVYQLMGQRFVLDAHVFQKVTYDRLKHPKTGAKLPRVLPSTLDVMFAMGSNTAAELIAEGELREVPYQHALHTTRYVVDGYPKGFWENNLYNGWLHAIRGLNDTTYRAYLPESMRTKTWDRKTLHTQLASWAELKHDTLLYAKQSFSASIACEYPDAQVEPVPELYRRMATLAERGAGVAKGLEQDGYKTGRMGAYFTRMGEIMGQLETISLKQLRREALTPGEVHFLKATIEKETVGCGETRYDGWFAELFYQRSDVGSFKPVVADIHTAPTDAEGNPVGWVLHAGTGRHYPMIVTVDHGDGSSHAYVGPVSSYFEHVLNNFERFDDNQWSMNLPNPKGGTPETPKTPKRPAWTEAFVK